MDEPVFLTASAMLEHWLGHRRLTRRVIEAFPEDQLYTYSLGGMRTFADLAGEMITMAVPTVEGAVTREWPTYKTELPKSKAEMLEKWDDDSRRIAELWPQIPPERFEEEDVAFGMFAGKVNWLLHYIIDNEIHHRGQGYVYLRALGVEPPAFYER
ncbi:MAG: DinB family protein [Trueperaceae bacterium]|nr:DinB family protein [Trueperaceae bacterium]MCO5173466.1 DinB family protein [Trueperaceae bacterium]MCW5819693.1 DinB family protein [Trueperaceae bacterium]